MVYAQKVTTGPMGNGCSKTMHKKEGEWEPKSMYCSLSIIFVSIRCGTWGWHTGAAHGGGTLGWHIGVAHGVVHGRGTWGSQGAPRGKVAPLLSLLPTTPFVLALHFEVEEWR